MHNVTLEELRGVIGLSDLPQEHLQWLLDHTDLYEFADGQLIGKTGDPADVMWIIVRGKIDFYMDVNGRLVYFVTMANDKLSGGISGLIPHSRMKTYPGNAFAVGNLRALALHRKDFADLEKLNPDFIQRLIGYMTERARFFATVQLQQEKVSALGKLSAGIAHELNNPASAISRIGGELRKRLDCNYEFTSKLLSSKNVTPAQIERLQAFAKKKDTETAPKLSVSMRMRAEDDISDWLEDHGISRNRTAAETFVDSG